jgi:hypothetical protein
MSTAAAAPITTLPPPIRRFLGEYAAGVRRARLARAALWALAAILTGALIACIIDRLFTLPSISRLTLLCVELGIALVLVARPLRNALRRKLDWIEASEQVERHDRSLGERLVTVTSQLLAAPSYRGSNQMLDALVGDVCGRVAHATPRRLIPWRSTRLPALVVLCLLALVSLLLPIDWLDLPRLLLRHVQPLADVPPVTTTQIDVSPGSTDVPQRQPLTVRATVRNFTGGSGAPLLHVLADGRDDSAVPMTSAGERDWSMPLPPVESDLRYFVEAGDATSPTYLIRVRRKPAVAEFRIRYNYPAYTGRPPLVVQTTEGLVEAPRGTEATLNITGTERLSWAVLRAADGRRIETWATGDPRIRQAKIAVDKDTKFTLELISDRGVEGRGPDVQLRAVPDRPPLVRLLQPAADVRLAPRDLLAITFQALDDYGVERVWADAQVNGGPAIAMPIRADFSDSRRVADSADIDLAALHAKVGDVVTVTLRATDRASQSGAAEPRHVLISPRSVDVATHQRITELRLAADHAKDYADQLAKAQQYLARAAREPAPAHGHWDANSNWNKAARQLASAQESAALVRQSLLRSIVHSAGPGMSDFLAAQIDSVVSQLDAMSGAEAALWTSEPKSLDADLLGRTSRAGSAARDLANQVKQLADGDAAAAALADRANLKASLAAAATQPAATQRAAAERRQQALSRARQELSAALSSLGINPKEKDAVIDQELQRRVQNAQRLVESARPVDFAGAASRWATWVKELLQHPPGTSSPPPQRGGGTRFEERLYAASHAEALRPDADLVAARDHQLAARAASVLARRAQPDWSEPPQDVQLNAWRDELSRSLDQFVQSLATLRAEHDVNRRAQAAQTVDQAKAIHAAAAQIHRDAAAARAILANWAGERTDTASRGGRSAEDLAMAANAYTATKDFDKAADADRQLAQQLGKPEIAKAADAPRAIDRASTDQEKLAARTDQAADDRQASAIAGAQRQVADEIARADDRAGAPAAVVAAPPAIGATSIDAADSRQRATESIGAAQERLAALPMQMLNAQQLATSLAEVSSRLNAAKSEAADAPPARRGMADGAVAQATEEYNDVQRAFNEAVAPIAGRLADDLADSLRPFAPETVKSVAAIDEQLKPALLDLQQALKQSSQGVETASVESGAQAVRDAIQESQDALRQAQTQVTERDPLVTAKWFARQAAQALSAAPPNRRSAAAHQKRTLEALDKAAYDALRRSKNARLSQLPAIGQLYLPPVAPDWPPDSPDAQERQRLINSLPGVREWGHLREQFTDPLTAPTREADPPGYSDALRIYFEVLGREDGGKTQTNPKNR